MSIDLIERFYQHSNPERAKDMAAYMKNKFPFLGISKPERTILARSFLASAKKAEIIDWALVERLWDLPEREFQYLAVDYLSALAKHLQKENIGNLKQLIARKSWWDTVDGLAPITGLLCSAYPELIESDIRKWSRDSSIWLKRAAILFQLKYKEETDTDLLGQIILENRDTNEFFINKAIGWALREYSKTNKEWVRIFIAANRLHSLSVREGSKYLG